MVGFTNTAPVGQTNPRDYSFNLQELAKLGNKKELLDQLKKISEVLNFCGVKRFPDLNLSLRYINNQTVTCNDGSRAG